MAINWPANVPHAPLANTFQGAPFRAPLATDLEDGPQRRRASTTLRIATLRFTIRMENDQFVAFKAFVDDDLVFGTLPFSMPVWTGSAFDTRTCSFREPYSDDAGHGLRHRVGIVIDVEDY